jgi:hypothetical protein
MSPIEKSKIRKDILERVCERCGEPIPDDDDFILTFFRGQFIVLHEECAEFIDNAQKGPRGKVQ